MNASVLGATVAGPAGEELHLIEFLGRGAFGGVYKAHDTAHDCTFAVKILLDGEFAGPEAERSILNEAALAARVDHPNVVRVLHCGRNEAVGLYVVMEYVDGGTLKALLAAQISSGRPLPLNEAGGIMRDIATGAKAINEQLIHRDIKPDNILLSKESLKVADFGISKVIAERTRTRTFKGVGPLSHMAPECWLGEANTPKIDVYAVGLVFFEVLALRHPLTPAQLAPSEFDRWRDAHLYETPPDIRSLRADVPLPISQLLIRMMSKRPQERPDWDEVLRVLSLEPAAATASTPAVLQAIARHREVEQARLAAARTQAKEQEVGRIYDTSFQQLIGKLDAAVSRFNEGFQLGAIRKAEARRDRVVYSLPNAPSLSIVLFPRRETGAKAAGGEVIGGAFIALAHGLTANLVLLRDNPEDFYGRWVVCLVNVNAVANPTAALALLDARPEVVPFGFPSAKNFYDQIGYVNSIHVFTYEFRPDVDGFFDDMIESAFNTPTPQGPGSLSTSGPGVHWRGRRR